MKHTNKFELPEYVRLWLEHDEYDYQEGVYSATRLMKPVRMVVLEKRHHDELEIDISDIIAPRYGHAIHDSFEKLTLPDAIQEQRFFAELNGERISGKPDILEKIELVDGKGFRVWDIKSTSVWTYIYGSRKKDYITQESIYKWLVMKDTGRPVAGTGKIIYIFTDWSRSKAKQGGDYPPIRVAVEDVQLMDATDTETYIQGRLDLFNAHMDTPEPELPKCTREELWQGDDKWAVMKEGRKSAVKVFDNEKEAQKFHMRLQGSANHHIEHRPGLVNRCSYCNVRPFCSQATELEKLNLIKE